MTSATLCPPMLRKTPQLGSVDLLVHAAEVAVIALCAAHPGVQQELGEDASPGDLRADRVIERAMTLLEAVDRYRVFLEEPRSRNEPPDLDIF